MAKKINPSTEEFNEILLYTTPNGKVKVEIYLQNETIWLSQQKIADLFGVQRPAITKHLKNIFESGELKEEMVSSILEHTTPHGAIEGKTQEKKVKYYNLDAIISVGYRVNSHQATAFRIWATERLKEYIIKGFTMDDERLKNPQNIFGLFFINSQSIYLKSWLELNPPITVNIALTFWSLNASCKSSILDSIEEDTNSSVSSICFPKVKLSPSSLSLSPAIFLVSSEI